MPNLVGTIFTAVENTDKVHNLVVCTLCSCYPLAVLGMSPAWYKSRSYRSRAVRDPRGVLKEFGMDLAPDVAVRVHDSTADMRSARHLRQSVCLKFCMQPRYADICNEPLAVQLM